jgi:hypothetical protein
MIIPNKKPEIIIHDNEKETCVLIDVTIPGGRNVIQKEVEKILKIRTLQQKHNPDTSNNKNHLKIIKKT